MPRSRRRYHLAVSWLDKLLAQKEIAVAIVSALGAIVLAIIAWGSGAGRWLGEQASSWLAEERRLKRMEPQLPKKTLYIVADAGLFPPAWSHHDFGNGTSATDCRTSLLITNLTRTPVAPVRAQVKLRGLNRFRRKPYAVHFIGPHATHAETVPPRSTAYGWFISFNVLPELTLGQKLRADIIVFDQFDNRHVAKNVCFTCGFPDALPT